MKLKDIDFSNIKFDKGVTLGDGTLINFSYLESSLEFQTPKVTIHSIVENDKMILTIKNTEACRKFYLMILAFEKMLGDHYHLPVQTIINKENFKIKVKANSTKIYTTDSRLFNIYHLKSEMEIICLGIINKIWISSGIINYNLNIKEIMLLKQ
jgi:hypothetical protein